MKKLWKVTLWAIALLSVLLVLGGCGGDKSEEKPDKKPGGGTHTCVGETWVTEKEATCKEDGSKTLVCACGKTVKTEVIPLGNHNVVNGVCIVCGSSRMEIRTVADLKNVASNLSGTYVLMNDLNLGGAEWTPIGTDKNMFEGVFDGNGHVISNFKITVDMECAGLFGYNNGEIKNLGVQGFTVDVAYFTSYNTYAGGLIGKNGGTVTNCYAEGSVCSNNTSTGWAIAGGLIGNNGGTITSCYAEGDVSSMSLGDSYAGGLVGYSYGRISLHAIITNCYAAADVSGASSGVTFVGGLIGYQGKSVDPARAAITGCYATGDVRGISSGSSMYVGGLVGRNEDGTITSCYAAGDVSGTSLDSAVVVGGLVGVNEGVITSCYAVGHVNGTSSAASVCVGGLVGSNIVGADDSVIMNCYAMGAVSGTCSTNYPFIGGLIGENGGTVTNCYAAGDVSGICSANYASVGGLVGRNYGTITNCYRYSGQSFTVTANGTTTYEATSTEGTATDMATLQSVDFQKNTLTWLSDDWNFTEGAHPTLK